ncbi:ABC transporter ATP-binding protein [Marinitenerispora sediminis]|uniref:ABC transporter ATP-binding protein n=1 Tax=Marinitenerispora sediminis TaxID=1931232 RepID=A0A368T6P2_9ACTN|nr:ABC transporter ATP-binding protein [Marinitenerispora sediminis]RCV55368.1 ABC transporter ATP-binding protein [Marinitenerispora sediminis]RCV59159.1 ABC transporter ATP-binding protein [Marinitenerispora sediminis]RCV59185.1 ABC transporter ATP-binding protein [Marinitenerispora sediminis]
MSTAEPLLAIRDLRVSFGERTQVELAELTLGAGEILGLAGESGAGKSLTGLAVLGLARRAGATVTGSIRLAGEELVGAPERRLRLLRGSTMALIPQSPAGAFNPVLPVGTTVLRALRLHRGAGATARERAESAMRRVWLDPEHLARYPHQLSGGQLQRVAIALGLALGAQLLIADEPTSALDVTVQAEICKLLAELRDKEEMSVLFVSHDLAVLAGLCDRIAVMRAGRVIEARPAGELVADPREDYTRELLAAVPRLGGATHA